MLILDWDLELGYAYICFCFKKDVGASSSVHRDEMYDVLTRVVFGSDKNKYAAVRGYGWVLGIYGEL